MDFELQDVASPGEDCPAGTGGRTLCVPWSLFVSVHAACNAGVAQSRARGRTDLRCRCSASRPRGMHCWVHSGSGCRRKCARWCITAFLAMHSGPIRRPKCDRDAFQEPSTSSQSAETVAGCVLRRAGAVQVRDVLVPVPAGDLPQHVRIERDHRNADQSDGGVAGSNGSPYRNTVPRIIPMNGRSVSPDAGMAVTAEPE